MGLVWALLPPLACRSYEAPDPAHAASGAAGKTDPASGAAGRGIAGSGDDGDAANGGQDAAGAQGGVADTDGVGAAPDQGPGGTSGGDPTSSAGLGGTGMAGEPEVIGGEAGIAGAGGQAPEPETASPGDFEGLVLWLEASTCTTDEDSRASLCPDGSLSMNDGTQVDAAVRPKLLPAALNGHSVLSFDGGPAGEASLVVTAVVVADALSLRLGTEDFTLALVARWRNSPQVQPSAYGGYGVILQKAQDTFPYRGYALFANYPAGYVNVNAYRRFAAQMEFGTATVQSYSVDLNDNEYRLCLTQRSPEELALRINGASNGAIQVAPGIDASAPYVPLSIGGGPGAPLRGEIAEIVLIRGAITQSDLGKLEAGLMQKYALD